MKTAHEKAIIVRYDILAGAGSHSKASTEALGELNSLMADGWRVKHASAMSGAQMNFGCSLVILERE